MVDETDISQEKEWLYEERARVVITSLQKKYINALYVPSRQEALSVILDMVPPGAVVARGDSISVDQVGVIQELLKRNLNAIIDPFERDAEGFFTAEAEQRFSMFRETFFADIFITGTNGVTLDGKLVNIDGHGNRVAAMIFGPAKVILVIGANKIVKDENEAQKRIHEVAAPMNAKRHYMKHHRPVFKDLPCVRTGICNDCNHEMRICHYTVIIEGAMIEEKGRINVVLVGEDLGL